MKQRVVVKFGGSSLHIPETLRELTALISGLRDQNYDVVLVHGGGPAINEELTRLGIEWKFINGQRQTTPEMMTVIEHVLARTVNGELVRTLKLAGIPAEGLSGARNILLCTQNSALLMQVGKIENVNTDEIAEIMAQASSPTPVIAPIGIGEDGKKYNINADWAAAKIAVALKADKLIFLTDQNGVLNKNGELAAHVTPMILEEMIADGTISGGMMTKVMTMVSALTSGLRQIRVLNAKVASHLISDSNVGTVLTQDEQEGSLWNYNMTRNNESKLSEKSSAKDSQALKTTSARL